MSGIRTKVIGDMGTSITRSLRSMRSTTANASTVDKRATEQQSALPKVREKGHRMGKAVRAMVATSRTTQRATGIKAVLT